MHLWLIAVIVILVILAVFLLTRPSSSRNLQQVPNSQRNRGSGSSCGLPPGGAATYEVTVQNLTRGQPLSPPVFVTHSADVALFRVGQLASQGINDISRDGNNRTIVASVQNDPTVTDVATIDSEIYGQTKFQQDPSLPSTGTTQITANPGDVLSGAMMISCSNNGFVGADSVALPASGSVTYLLQGYDAGRELNTERSEDIPDPCSVGGIVPLRGKPNGNRDAEVDRIPPVPVKIHAGIRGDADLSVYAHGWEGPLAQLTITKLS